MSAELKRRKPAGAQCQNEQHANGKTARQARAARPPVRPTRSIHLAISVVILAFFALYSQRKAAKAPYTVDAVTGGKPLPEWYAVCGRDGRKAVYTVPSEGGIGQVECVVVGGKHVVDTGSIAHVRRKWGDKATTGPAADSPEQVKKAGGITIIYLPAGHTLTPGLIDGHGHPLEYGASREVVLHGAKSAEECARRAEEYLDRRGPLEEGEIIFGVGWDQNHWPVKEFPSASDLDTPKLHGLPIVLLRADIHAAWVSPLFLNKIIDKFGPLPTQIDGGHVERDAAGNPTGVFVDNAIGMFVTPLAPAKTDADRERQLDIVGRDALAHGLVGVHDAMVPPEDIRFFKRMADEGKLPIRFYSMLLCPNKFEYCGDDVEMIENAGDYRFSLTAVKLFGDGALGSRGAALIDDYSDRPGWKGFLLAKEEVWKPLVKAFYEKGWQVNIHAIGDLANKVVVDAIEAAIGPDRAAGLARRIRIEHAQIFTPEDLKRAVDLGVIASYQPTHATSDMWYAEDRLGPERIKGAYAWRSYLDQGGRIVLGSDFPVESIDPLKGFYAAVSRRAEDGSSPHGRGGWFPAEKLTREEALRGFTADAAYASFSNNTGSLTPGYRFDAVLWDDDLLSVDEDEMLEVKCKATIMDGRIVYGSWAR